MVKLKHLPNNTVEVTGKTFEHKGTIKSLGGVWNASQKVWIVPKTSQNLHILKTLTTTRRCGHCGETGHFKPKCKKYHDERKKELVAKAEALWIKRPCNYERHKATGFCHCGFEHESFGYKDFSVLMPKVCGVCNNWCCAQARPMDKDFLTNMNTFRFVCPTHGDCFYQLLNDTRGT